MMTTVERAKKRNPKGIVTGIGEVLWDILPDGKKIGGAPANFACHISHFGYNGVTVSAIGNDKLGDMPSSWARRL